MAEETPVRLSGGNSMKKYGFRTVVWRFKDSDEMPDELKSASRMSQIKAPEDVLKFFKPLFENQCRERFVVVWLSASNGVMGFEIVTEGILNSSLVHPREIFRGAIVSTCAAIILIHNHPSDNAEPSSEDVQMTQQVVEAGKIIGIPVHDHIIVTNTSYTSFAERGLI